MLDLLITVNKIIENLSKREYFFFKSTNFLYNIIFSPSFFENNQEVVRPFYIDFG